MLKKEINFFSSLRNSYDLAKLAIFWKFSLFLYDLDFYVGISYRPHRPHFRLAFFTSYNFFFGCLYRWFEKVGQKIHSLTSPPKFSTSKNQRSMFLIQLRFFPYMVVKRKVVAHITSNIFIYKMTYFSWKKLVIWLLLSRENVNFLQK